MYLEIDARQSACFSDTIDAGNESIKRAQKLVGLKERCNHCTALLFSGCRRVISHWL